MVHTTRDWPTLIGADCVVGHNAHLEGCVVEDRCLIGSGSVTLNRARIGTGAIVAAAALVPEGFEVPPGALVAGVPATIKKTDLPADTDRGVGPVVYRVRSPLSGRTPASRPHSPERRLTRAPR